MLSACAPSAIPSIHPRATHADYAAVAQQLQEMAMVREKVYQMEQTHLALKQKYVPIVAEMGLHD